MLDSKGCPVYKSPLSLKELGTRMQRTFVQKNETAQTDRKWHVVDVAGLTLGRACSQIAHVIRGKHKPTFTKHVDSGDFVIVLNASKIHLTGKKMEIKLYRD